MSRQQLLVRLVPVAVCLSLIMTNPVSATTLPVPVITQEQTLWCWAAVTVAVLDYYGQPTEQCALAEDARINSTVYNYGQVECCLDPTQGCNQVNQMFDYPGSAEDILNRRNIPNDGSWRNLTAAQVENEIAAKKPFLIVWMYNPDFSHAIVGHGFDGTLMDIMDPWFGEGHKIATYNWVLDGPDHDWWGTSTMNVSPCECLVVSECCDGCQAIGEGLACEDANLCTESSVCQNGLCQPGTTIVCPENDSCKKPGICDPLTGDCQFDNQPDGVTCEFGDVCVTSAACLSGECLPETQLADWSPCGPGAACFSGHCEPVLLGDTCDDPIEAVADQPTLIQLSQFHRAWPKNEACPILDIDGNDVFFELAIDPTRSYTLKISGNENRQVFAAAFENCASDIACRPLASWSTKQTASKPWVFDHVEKVVVAIVIEDISDLPVTIEFMTNRKADPILGTSCSSLGNSANLVLSHFLTIWLAAIIGRQRKSRCRSPARDGA